MNKKVIDHPVKKNIFSHPITIYVVYPLIVIFLLWAFKTPISTARSKYQIESYRSNVAFLIYPEVLGNVKKLNLCISKIENGEKLNLEKIKFSQECNATT